MAQFHDGGQYNKQQVCVYRHSDHSCGAESISWVCVFNANYLQRAD